ncbi:MAG TPA: tyrosine-type recombinase/integrase [Micromonosporaceae bacterium]
MQHPKRVWTDEENADIGLSGLMAEYRTYLTGRARPAARGTIDKCAKSMKSLVASIERAGEPPILGSLTPAAVSRWISEQRSHVDEQTGIKGRAEEGIASRLAAVKVFTNRYVYRHLDLTTVDLLARVERLRFEEKPLPRLTDEEIEAILTCFNRGSDEDVRDLALITVFLATGLRFREVVEEMTVSGFDRISGRFTVIGKGGQFRTVQLSPRALKTVRRYLTSRPEADSDQFWLREDGLPLTYWGGMLVFRRVKARSGVTRLHAHVRRHTFAQIALQKGAERAMVQDMMGHRTDRMARRYAGTIRQETATAAMPRCSPI